MIRFLSLFFISIQMVACIGTDLVDDFVQPELRIGSVPDTIGFGESYQFTASYFNNVGQPDVIELDWATSDASIIDVDSEGLATAIAEGTSVITVSAEVDGETILDEISIAAGAETIVPVEPEVRVGQIETTTFYELTGGFEINEIADGIRIDIMDDYRASSALPGLFVYLTNNPNTTAGALEIGPVRTFSGAHSYEVSQATIDQYSHILYFCKPFNVKVGDGEIKEL